MQVRSSHFNEKILTFMGHYICTVKATEGFGIPQGDVDRSIHGQELNATVPDPDRTPIFLDLDRI